MKFYIQDSLTADFIRCDSTWSANINEALDFLSERRAYLYGMKELKNSFQVLKVALETSLPALIPQLILSGSSQFPSRATNHTCEQVPLMQRLQSSVLGLREKLPGLGEVSRLNLF